MTSFQVVIVPAILAAIFLAGVMALLIWAARKYVTMITARRDAYRATGQRYDRMRALAMTQADAIDATIGDMEAHSSVYEVFSQGVRDQLLAAHDAARDLH